MRARQDRVGTAIAGFTDWPRCRGIAIIHSLDITEECPLCAFLHVSVLLDYGQATTGIVFQLTSCYPGSDEGMSIMHPLESLQRLEHPGLGNFHEFAEQFGISSEELVLIVQSQAPTLDRKRQIEDFRAYALEPDKDFEPQLAQARLTPADLQRPA